MRIFLGQDIIELPDSMRASLELERSAAQATNAALLSRSLGGGEEQSLETLLGWLREQGPIVAHIASERTEWDEEEVLGTSSILEAIERLDDGLATRVLVSGPFRMRIERAFEGEGWIVVGDSKAWASFLTAEMVRFHFEHRDEWMFSGDYVREANLAQRRFLPPSLWTMLDEACMHFHALRAGIPVERNVDACLDFVEGGLFEEDAFDLFMEMVQEA